jgi:hypothetical protein
MKNHYFCSQFIKTSRWKLQGTLLILCIFQINFFSVKRRQNETSPYSVCIYMYTNILKCRAPLPLQIKKEQRKGEFKWTFNVQRCEITFQLSWHWSICFILSLTHCTTNILKPCPRAQIYSVCKITCYVNVLVYVKVNLYCVYLNIP